MSDPPCTDLLSLVVAGTVRFVSERRPDLAVQAHAELNACIGSGEATALLDLRTEAGRARLRIELADADLPVTRCGFIVRAISKRRRMVLGRMV